MTKATSLAALIRSRKVLKDDIRIRQQGLLLEASEYKTLLKSVLAEFYNIAIIQSEQEMQLIKKETKGASVNVAQSIIEPSKPATTSTYKKKLSYKEISQRYVKIECEKLKSSDKTKGCYIKTGKLLDAFFKDKDKSELTYADAENFQAHLLLKNLHKKTVNNRSCFVPNLNALVQSINRHLLSSDDKCGLEKLAKNYGLKATDIELKKDEYIKIKWLKVDVKELMDAGMKDIWELERYAGIERDDDISNDKGDYGVGI